MVLVQDCQVDEADDIVVRSGDIALTDNPALSAVLCAGRRLSAKETDFLIDDIAPMIEKRIQSYITPFMLSEMESDIRKSLGRHNLFQNNEYDVLVIDNNDRTVSVYLRFTSGDLQDLYRQSPFRILINLNEQRIYR